MSVAMMQVAMTTGSEGRGSRDAHREGLCEGKKNIIRQSLSVNII